MNINSDFVYYLVQTNTSVDNMYPYIIVIPHPLGQIHLFRDCMNMFREYILDKGASKV